jgi:hypothetical protein
MRRSPVAGVVLSWMPVSQRSATLADRLGYELLLLGRPGFRRPWTAPLAYPLLAIATAWWLLRSRPAGIVVVVPPFVAAVVAWTGARFGRHRLAVDIHSGAMLDRRWRWSVPILAAIARRSTVAIVTVDTLAARLRDRGVADVMVMPDPLPTVAVSGSPAGTGDGAPGAVHPLVVAVLGWGDDEPIEELVAAAAGRPWRLELTGRPRRRIPLPENVRSTGFLAGPAYGDRLVSADLVVVLTTREDTLLSGAWETIALGRPLVVSSTAALVSAFGPDVAAAGDDPESIRAAIEAALGDPAAADRSRTLRDRFLAASEAHLAELRRRLEVPPRG